jgi:hypothetical protein
MIKKPMPAHYRIVRTSVDRVPYKVAFQVRILRGGKATKHFRIVHLSAQGLSLILVKRV